MNRLSRSGQAGLALLALLGGLALAAPFLPLPAPEAMSAELRLRAPRWIAEPILGTDLLGRDLLARLLAGARVSLFVGLMGSLIAGALGAPYGALAGLLGGACDRWMMRFVDFLDSVPLVVVVLFLLSLLGEYRAELAEVGIGRLQLFYLAVGLLFWLPTARVARAEALRLRHAGFVAAAAAAGAGRLRLLGRHLLPNMTPALLAQLGNTVPRVVLMEAFLSFLGLGVEPPAVSWGLLAAEGMGALNPLVDCWWLLAFPAAALSLSLLAFHWLAGSLARG